MAPLYLDSVNASFSKAGFEPVSIVIPAGEGSKNFDTLSGILEFLADSGLTRSDLVVALGGGVTGDIAGFAAGVYMRGISLVQLPTTLLAAVDSSVGGKTAIDLKSGKNLAGVFLQPKSVICDTDTLSSLSPETISCGMAEAIKTAILSGNELFSLFESANCENRLGEIISMCVAYKGAIVEADEFEFGERKLLNLGHTIGHAIEKLSGYKALHGQAVAAGTAIITRFAHKTAICSEDCKNRLISVLQKYDLPIDTPYSPQQLSKAALADKKRSGNKITLVLPREIGDCVLKTVPLSELETIIKLGSEN